MARPTEDSVKGGLIILAGTIVGAVLLAVVGFYAMLFLAEWLWVEPRGPSVPPVVDGATWGWLPDWLKDQLQFAGRSATIDPIDPYARLGVAKAAHVAPYAFGGVVVGLVLGSAMGAAGTLKYLSRAESH